MKKIAVQIIGSIAFMLLFSFTSCKKGDPVAPADLGLDDIKEVFDLQWLPVESFGDLDGNIAIEDGMPVWLITDGIGKIDIPYTGEPVPSVRFKTPPIFKKGKNGEHDYIFFPNARAQYYGDNSVPLKEDGSTIEQPFTVYAVVRRLQAINNEAYWNRGMIFRNRNDNHYQLGVASFVDFPVGSGILEANKISIVKVVYDGPNSKIWINNEPYADGASVDVGSKGLQILGYGTIAHIAHHDLFGFWMKHGLLTDSENKFIYETLSEIYSPDEFPQYPIADNLDIIWDNSNKSWTIDYDYINPDTTVTEANTKYQWYVRVDGESLEQVYPLAGPNAQKKTLLRSDFPIDLPAPYPSNAQIYCGVQVDGTWRELHSPYEKDNIE